MPAPATCPTCGDTNGRFCSDPWHLAHAPGLSHASAIVLAALREMSEGAATMIDGRPWRLVYLPNVGSSRAFAGHLSVLAQAGLYRPMNSGTPSEDRFFGYVLATYPAQE